MQKKKILKICVLKLLYYNSKYFEIVIEWSWYSVVLLYEERYGKFTYSLLILIRLVFKFFNLRLYRSSDTPAMLYCLESSHIFIRLTLFDVFIVQLLIGVIYLYKEVTIIKLR